jgi:glycosyltransferase involved in cell wall biosynthesis
MNIEISCKLGIQQRVLPAYRAVFFDLLAQSCLGGLSVFAGTPRPGEALGVEGELKTAVYAYAENMHLGRGRLYACHQRNFLTWLERWDPQVLIVEANPRYLSTPGAVKWMKERKRPVIGWGLGAPPHGGFWRNLLRDRFLSSFDALLTYSQRGAEEYRALGFSEDCVFLAPNAITPRPSYPVPLRSKTYQDGRAQVLFVGRLQARKRIDLLLQACASLPAELQPDVTVVGDGPARSGLENLAKRVYPRTVFAGEKHGQDVEPFFQNADLFVLPGTGGLAVQHAMSFGLPVIVSEADGTQADLVRPSNGWLVKPGSSDALRETLIEALADVDRLREMGCESYRVISEEINLEAMVAGFARAIQFVCGGATTVSP